MSLLVETGLRARTGLLVTGASDIPSWVEALRAPSGDLPLVASWWAGAGNTPGGLHWLAGTGIVQCLDIYYENNDDWGLFDPERDVVEGLGLGGPLPNPDLEDFAEPVLVPEVSALFGTTGLTFLNQMFIPVVPDGGTLNLRAGMEWADYPDYTTDMFGGPAVVIGAAAPGVYSFSADGGVNTVNVSALTTSGTHKYAFTMSPTLAGFSIDGGAAVNLPDIIYEGPPNAVAVQAGNGNDEAFAPTVKGYVSIMAYYPPQPSADLPALTAP